MFHYNYIVFFIKNNVFSTRSISMPQKATKALALSMWSYAIT